MSFEGGVAWLELLTGGELRNVNLVLAGPFRQQQRIAELLFIVLVGLEDESGHPAFPLVLVVLPPDLADTVIEDLSAAASRLRGTALDEEERGILTRRLAVRRMPSRETSVVAKAVSDAPGGSFIVVADGAGYRSSENASTVGLSPRVPEDLWVHPLRDLAHECVKTVGQTSCVLIDTWVFLPSFARNREALQDLEDCTIWGTEAAVPLDERLLTRTGEWTDRVLRADVESVLAEIDELPNLGQSNRTLIKIQVLYKGQRSQRAVELIRAHLMSGTAVDAEEYLKFSTIASSANDVTLAKGLLQSCMADLRELEHLELALHLSRKLEVKDAGQTCVDRLIRYFPHSSELENHRVIGLMQASERSELYDAKGVEQTPFEEFAGHLTTALAGTLASPDYVAILNAVADRWPRRSPLAGLAAAVNARARNLPMQAAQLANPADLDTNLAEHAAQILLWSVERLVLSRGAERHDVLSDAVVQILRYLAVNPANAHVRERLDELLSIDVSGSVGTVVLAHALLRLVPDQFAALAEPPPVVAKLNPDQFTQFFEDAIRWLNIQGGVDLASVVLPKSLLSLPADEALQHLKRLLQYVVHEDLEDTTEYIQLIVVAAFAIAPHATRRDDDLVILRLATSRLVMSGEGQMARDLVEAGLNATHASPKRSRLAWYAYSDVFHRGRNRHRALMALGCAFASGAPVGLDQAYYETMGVVRALRDTGLVDYARSFLERCEVLLENMGLSEAMSHRIETVRLSLDLHELGRNRSSDAEAWRRLLLELDANLAVVVRASDELGPVLVLAVQVLRHCEQLGAPVDGSVRDRIEAAAQELGTITTDLIQLASNRAMGPEQLMGLVKAVQSARYAEDVGFDVQWLVRAARALLSNAITTTDTTIATFAAELLTDHGITMPRGAQGAWLPTELAEPAQVLRALAHEGITVELLAVDADEKLVRFTAQNDDIRVKPEEANFSMERLHAWSRRFPFELGFDNDDANIFYTSMQGLGLSGVADGSRLFVLDTQLQQLPPQLLLFQNELLGRNFATAVAPSLTWLRAAIDAPMKEYGRPYAWISTDVEGRADGTLSMLADRLAETLADHDVALNTGAEIPSGLKGAELAIVAAHGGLDEGRKFFQVVANEARLRVSAIHLARALETACVAVLFVCSGGRQDEHPVASTTVGLPKQLLDRGCSAVVASPWPLDSRVPSHWLPTFLTTWAAGERLIDATFAANRAVVRAMGDDPKYAMALTVYGNPLLRRSETALPKRPAIIK